MIKNLKNLLISKTTLILIASLFILSACGSATPPNCEGIAEVENGSMSCEEYLAREQRECWQAQTLNLMYTTMGRMAMGAYKDMTQGAMTMMMIGFSLWFAMKMLRFVGSLKADKENSPGEFWTDVLKKFALCYACGFLASSTDGLLYVLNMFLFPVFNAFLEFSGAILAKTGQIVDNLSFSAFGEQFPAQGEQSVSVICSVEKQNLGAASLSGFPQGANNMMQCMICALSDKLNLGFSVSFRVFQAGYLVPKIIGIFLLFSFTFVKLGFVFYLVDTLFRFTMMVTLLPLFIMGWAFDLTKGWTKTAIPILLHAAALVMTTAIIISMTILAIVRIIQVNPELFGDDSDWAFREFSPALLVLLLIAFLVKGSMGIAGKLTSIIVNTNIESSFQKKLQTVLKLVAQGIGALVSLGSLAPVFAKWNKLQQVIEKVKKIKNKVDEVKEKMDKLAGKEKDEEGEEGEDKGEEENEK